MILVTSEGMNRFLLLIVIVLFTTAPSPTGESQTSSSAEQLRGFIRTVAGVPGRAGFDDGPVSSATFNRPTWIDVAQISMNWFGRPVTAGDIFVIDRLNNAIRLISKDGVSTYRVWRDWYPNLVDPVDFDFDGPMGGGIVVEPPDSGCGGGDYDSGMFVASSGTHQIVLVSMNSLLASRDGPPVVGIAGSPGSNDGSATTARFYAPTALALSRNYGGFPTWATFEQRRLYVADTGNHTVRRIRFGLSFQGCPNATFVETLAGRAGEAGQQDGQDARFNGPRGLAVGPDGSVYVADTGNHAIRRIAPDGTVTTIAGELGISGSNDGLALEANLHSPSAIDINAKGEIFIADTGNHVIRKVTTDGRLITIAGSPGIPGFTDGDAATAKFNGPLGLRIAPDGSLLIADTSNNAIRRYFVDSPQRRRPIRR